jgi:hypothetical protein
MYGVLLGKETKDGRKRFCVKSYVNIISRMPEWFALMSFMKRNLEQYQHEQHCWHKIADETNLDFMGNI